MRKAALTLVATLLLALAMALTSGVALAGWGYDDCPPGSTAEFIHASATATSHVTGLTVPANPNATVGNQGGHKTP